MKRECSGPFDLPTRREIESRMDAEVLFAIATGTVVRRRIPGLARNDFAEAEQALRRAKARRLKEGAKQ